MNSITNLKAQTLLFISMLTGRLGDRERGATATEYALLVGFIAIIIIGAVTIFGSDLSNLFTHAGDKIPPGTATTPPAAG
jgi:pilus assembly protein Flp/PilA